MKKACGYKSLDGKIYVTKAECLDADDNFEIRRLQEISRKLKRDMYDIITHIDRKLVWHEIPQEHMSEKELREFKILRELKDSYLDDLVVNLVMRNLDDLNELRRQYQRDIRKIKSVENRKDTFARKLLKALKW